MKNHDCFIKLGGRTFYSWDSKNPSDWCSAGYREGMEPTATHTGDWVQDPNSRFDNIMVNIQPIEGVTPVEPQPLTSKEASAIVGAQRLVNDKFVVRMGYTIKALTIQVMKDLPGYNENSFSTWRFKLVPVEGKIVDKVSGFLTSRYKIEQADGTFVIVSRDEVLEITSKNFDVDLDNAKTPKVYIAEMNGQVFTRQSSNRYTHAVICENRETGKLEAFSFHSRADLARKVPNYYPERNTLHVVPVTIQQK